MFVRKLVFSMVANNSGFLTRYNGPLFRAAFLKILRERNPSLAKKIHDSGERKPYSLVSLRPAFSDRSSITKRNEYRVKPGDGFLCSVTFFDKTILENAIHALMGSLDWSVNIGKVNFSIGNIDVQSLDLLELFQKGTNVNKVQLSLNSPTYFKTTDGAAGVEFFPRPRIVYGFLFNQWDEFSEETDPIPPTDFTDWTKQKIKVSSFKIRTVASHVMKGIPLSGTIGWVRFEWEEKAPYNQWAYMLLKFAEFSNLGAARTAGYGEVQVKDFEK